MSTENKESKDEKRQLKRQDPSELLIYRGLGLSQEEMAKNRGIVAACDAALVNNPMDIKILNQRAMALAEMGKNQLAMAAYDQILKLDPENTAALYNQGFVFGLLKMKEKALANIGKVLEKDPTLFHAYYLRYLLLYFTPDNAVAKEALLEKVIKKMNPTHYLEHYLHALVLCELGKYQEAVEALNQVLAIAPGFAEAHYTQGSYFSRLKEYSKGAAACGQAKKLRPDKIEVLALYIDNLVHAQDFKEAWEAFNEMLQLDSTSAHVVFTHGQLLVATKQYEKAVACLDKLCGKENDELYSNLSPDHQARAFREHGAALMSLGRHAEAYLSLKNAWRIAKKKCTYNDPLHADISSVLLMQQDRSAQATEKRPAWLQATVEILQLDENHEEAGKKFKTLTGIDYSEYKKQHMKISQKLQAMGLFHVGATSSKTNASRIPVENKKTFPLPATDFNQIATNIICDYLDDYTPPFESPSRCVIS